MRKPSIPFKTYDEFWEFCNSGKCPDRTIGCAKTCIYRKLLNLPPFGRRYILSGKIEKNV